MRGTELACAAIVALYGCVRLGAPGVNRGAIARRLLLLACAAWVGEDSVIRAYGFYGYAPEWSLFVDRVPLLIVAIWPVVIDSAHMLARALVTRGPRVPLVGGLIVLADASLIEPIAVRAHLWSWSAENARAVFDVPAIGILGWAYFAAAAIALLELLERRETPAYGGALVIAVAPAAAHAALVLSWWCAFRWLGAGGEEWLIPAVAWVVALPVTLAAWRKGSEVPLRAVMARAPGAAFFFALLATSARDRADLVLYALAFAPPYLALAARSKRLVSPSRSKSTSWQENTMI
jgi:hypothetical protein